MSERLLSVEDLQVSFSTRDGENQAVRGVSFHIDAGETVGIVGESGSGKSVTAKAIMSLITPPGKITSGTIEFHGRNLAGLPEKEWRKLRGNRIAMVFQDPMTSLNPVKKIGQQLTEVIRRHRGLNKAAAYKEAAEMLRQVGIRDPEQRLNQYPHEFSGGMRQRVMIAMALSCQPELLIADEPTTALDATIQAQILDLFKELKGRSDTAVALITHDLGVVAQVCTRVIVMYGGLVMEEGKVEDIFYRPQHPYTQGLLRSIPKRGGGSRERLIPIEGTPPDLLDPPPGCPFMERCPHAFERCSQRPPVTELSPGHRSMCWLAEGAQQPLAAAAEGGSAGE
ncbi:ABC transporter ATP-binding protein [Paenibacillus sp. NFR01]|uniref:ABC transporter ATP-binding protein n=1 Tax=Paenibacillus sp. NFR01 TaxID=1566279 RepID=UPI0008BF5AD9|nr:ABC transporter ATP-binding protein [Paenibacillus sp. NFR01]SEU26414.1 oligopeptide/dipeptide ABC transporter, ATP-binding protein, C-terminal domain-containing protein [Paenibacillus sp. NFR01]